MIDKPNALHTFGLAIEGKKLLVAGAALGKGGPKLETVTSFDLEAEEGVNPLYSSEEGRDFLNAFQKQLTAAAVPGRECLIRTLDVKLKKEKDIDEVLPFQAEPLLPYSVDEAVLDWIRFKEEGEETTLTLAAVKKEQVEKQLELWKRLDIDPEILSAKAAALALFSKHFGAKEAPHFVVHFGADETTCLFVEEGRPAAAKSCSGDLLEVVKTLYALSKQRDQERIGQVLVTGLPEAVEKAAPELAEKLEKEALVDREFGEFALPIGLALSGLSGCGGQINFRQQQFAYPNPWKRLKRPVLAYFALCLLFAFGLHFSGSAYLGYREDALRRQYGELLSFMNKREPVPLKEMDAEAVRIKLAALEKEVKNAPNPVALLPDTPRVSDFLAWLSTHPNVALESGDSPQVVIENFGYTMVQRPEENKKGNRYQVKVELVLSSPSPSLAREFHDALIAPNDYVDPKSEVKWSANRGKYRTTFYLKDKTVYPR